MATYKKDLSKVSPSRWLVEIQRSGNTNSQFYFIVLINKKNENLRHGFGTSNGLFTFETANQAINFLPTHLNNHDLRYEWVLK